MACTEPNNTLAVTWTLLYFPPSGLFLSGIVGVIDIGYVLLLASLSVHDLQLSGSIWYGDGGNVGVFFEYNL